MEDSFNNNNYVFIALLVFFSGLFVIVLLFAFNGDSKSCVKNGDCFNNQMCVGGTCKLRNGQSCGSNGQCVSGYCNEVCIDLPTVQATTVSRRNIPKPVLVNPRVFSQSSNNPPAPSPLPEVHPPVYVPPPPEPQMDMWFDGNQSEILVTGAADALNYSSSTIILLKSGKIQRNAQIVNTNLGRIDGIASFDGYLLALSGGFLYYLDTSRYESNTWHFVMLKTPIEGNVDQYFGKVIRISTDIYNTHLILQTQNTLYVINRVGIEEEISFPSDHRRVYGPTVDDYIDIDLTRKIATVHGGKTDGQVLHYILDAVMDNTGVVYPLTTNRASMGGYVGIRLVDWVPRYIK